MSDRFTNYSMIIEWIQLKIYEIKYISNSEWENNEIYFL